MTTSRVKHELNEFMDITIKVSHGDLVTHRGKRPFKLPKQCPICGETMRLKQMHNGTCDEDPFYFRIVCSCCGTEITTEADEVE